MRAALILWLCCQTVLGQPALVVTPPTPHALLIWDYPTNQLATNLWFNFYETTNLSTPLAEWNLLTNVVGTNLSVGVSISPGQHFIVGTASNFWGETSITSNITVTPPLPVAINDSVRIEKSP